MLRKENLKILITVYPQFDFESYKNEVGLYKDQIVVFCKKHQQKFFMRWKHAKTGKCLGCKECISEAIKQRYQNKKIPIFELIEKWKVTDKFNYDYSLIPDLQTKYTDKTKIQIRCNKHGIFETTVGNKQHGNGNCHQCCVELNQAKEKISTETWIDRFKSKYHDLYDYSLIKSIKSNTEKLPIICPRHGIFWQSANKHYDSTEMCPKCQIQSKGEILISEFLDQYQIKYEREKTYPDLIGLRGSLLRYDFYLSKENILIEYDGIVHFQDRFNNAEKFQIQQIHDQMKTEYALNHYIQLIRINKYKDISEKLNFLIKD